MEDLRNGEVILLDVRWEELLQGFPGKVTGTVVQKTCKVRPEGILSVNGSKTFRFLCHPQRMGNPGGRKHHLEKI